jgi:hypothetical protein
MTSDILQNGNRYPIGILLLKSVARLSDGHSKLSLPLRPTTCKSEKAAEFLEINDKLRYEISTHLIDIYIYIPDGPILIRVFFKVFFSLQDVVEHLPSVQNGM